MLKLSKKVEYALIALLYMDQRSGEGLASTKEIAETFHVPAELLGKVLQTLARVNLLESVKGSHGGYRVRKPIDQLSVGEVIEAIEGPVLIVPCCDGSDTCRQHDTCNIRAPIQRIQEDVRNYIHQLPLAAFRQNAADAGTTVGKELRV